MFDEGQLPIPKSCVGRAIPVTAELLAPAERQIVNDATREIIVEVDLRQTPIQLLPIRKREIGRTQQGTQTVGEAIIVGARIGVTKQSVEAVPGRPGLGFDLQRVVSGVAEVAELQHGVLYRVRRYVRGPIGIAPEGIAAY